MEIVNSRLLGNTDCLELPVSFSSNPFSGPCPSKIRVPLGWKPGNEYVIYFLSGHYELIECSNINYRNFLLDMMLPEDRTVFPEAMPPDTISHLYNANLGIFEL